MRLNHHQIKTTLALALALGAIAPATASARLDLNPPATTTPSQPAVQIVRISPPAGFDWSDAGIGAAGGVALSAICLGGALVVSGQRTRRAQGTKAVIS